MQKSFLESINAFFEKISYHVTYEIIDEKIIKKETNTSFGSNSFTYFMFTLLIIFVSMLIIINITASIKESYDEKVFLNTYESDQICIDNSQWVECYTFNEEGKFKISLDEKNPELTIFIKRVD